MIEDRHPLQADAPSYPRLLGDIGGTNARFGLQLKAGEAIMHVQVLPCAEYASMQDAVRHYLQHVQQPMPPIAALGMANPVTADEVAMTNHHWRFSISALRQSLGLQRLVVLNDFTALALALPFLPAHSLRQVGGTAAVAHAAIGLLGAGTGLGVSGLLPNGAGAWLPLSGEGGHVSLAAQSALEFAVIQHLQQRFGHVSAERVLSGQGLVDLAQALQDLSSGSTLSNDMTSSTSRVAMSSPAEVMQQDQVDAVATQALDLFCGFLGTVAGDLALTLGARGGVYIGGGIVPRLSASRFAASPFRTRFEAKGRFSNYLQAIPVWVIDSPVSPALQGASAALNINSSAPR
jgi:glucokinase